MRKAAKRGCEGFSIQKSISETNKCICRAEHLKAAQLSTRAELCQLTSGSEGRNISLKTNTQVHWARQFIWSPNEEPSSCQSITPFLDPVIWLSASDSYPQTACFVPMDLMYIRTQSLQSSPLWWTFWEGGRGVKSSLFFCFCQTPSPWAAGTPHKPEGWAASNVNGTRSLMRSQKSTAYFQLYTWTLFSTQTKFLCCFLSKT